MLFPRHLADVKFRSVFLSQSCRLLCLGSAQLIEKVRCTRKRELALMRVFDDEVSKR